MTKHVKAGMLDVAYECHGDAAGWPVVLTHGFPYDPTAYYQVGALLADEGAFVVAPFMRGYGPTTFLSDSTLRSGQQAAFGFDLRELILALDLRQPIVGGYDWGGRASCVVAALWPELVSGLVSVNGYNVQNIAKALQPADPRQESRLWYQYYFHSERGRAGLAKNRRALCLLLWELWSPTWSFGEAIYQRSAESFENPDFVDVVIHSYRHRYGLVAGDPAFEPLEAKLALQAPISVAAITLDGSDDGIWNPKDAGEHAKGFSGFHEHRDVKGAGHNLPQEAPEAFAKAVLDLHRRQH